jgi:hypothetical protein
MQNLKLAIKERILAEYTDFELEYPRWLLTVLDDDVYYTITLLAISACSFAVGLLVGWIGTL